MKDKISKEWKKTPKGPKGGTEHGSQRSVLALVCSFEICVRILRKLTVASHFEFLTDRT